MRAETPYRVRTATHVEQSGYVRYIQAGAEASVARGVGAGVMVGVQGAAWKERKAWSRTPYHTVRPSTYCRLAGSRRVLYKYGRTRTAGPGRASRVREQGAGDKDHHQGDRGDQGTPMWQSLP